MYVVFVSIPLRSTVLAQQSVCLSVFLLCQKSRVHFLPDVFMTPTSNSPILSSHTCKDPCRWWLQNNFLLREVLFLNPMHLNAFDILISKKNLSALQKPLKHILIVFVCSSIAVWTLFTYGIRDMFAVSHRCDKRVRECPAIASSRPEDIA